MRRQAWTIVAAVLVGGQTPDVAAEIYACEGDDGVTSYQDQPCPELKPAAQAKDAQADPDPAWEPSPDPETTEPVDADLVAACKKRYRDEIDRLDAEIRKGFQAEEREAYREQARALSQQLSRCGHGGTNTASGDGGPEPAGRDL